MIRQPSHFIFYAKEWKNSSCVRARSNRAWDAHIIIQNQAAGHCENENIRTSTNVFYNSMFYRSHPHALGCNQKRLGRIRLRNNWRLVLEIRSDEDTCCVSCHWAGLSVKSINIENDRINKRAWLDADNQPNPFGTSDALKRHWNFTWSEA